MALKPENVLFLETPAQLRAWFESNHATATELWLGFHRKRTGRPSLTWQQVVDEELCFGWIDGVRYSLDDERFAHRITPRRKRSVWSAVNVRRFAELDKLGLVHPNGRTAFAAREDSRSSIYVYENRSRGFDQAREKIFRKSKDAWAFFQSQAPWYRRTATYWVMSAKREETRDSRLRRLIEHSKKGERIPPLSRPRGRRTAAGSPRTAM
jgi:uncharacterized protein YdeI (YjbR/CyaY-like superfamily)